MQMQFRLIISSLIILVVFSSDAQDLKLVSGSKNKILKTGTFISLELPKPDGDYCKECVVNEMTGELISYAEGKLTLKVSDVFEPIMADKKIIGYAYKKYEVENAQPVLEVPSDIILSITKKGKKEANEQTATQVVGYVLIVLGISHLASVPIVELSGEDSWETLLWAGVAETVIGISLAAIFKQTRFITNGSSILRKSHSRIWAIN